MNNFLRYSVRFCKRNASTILTCIGGAGVVATTVMAVKATPKALRLIEEAKIEKGEELTKFEVVLAAGPAYTPAAVTGVATVSCIFGANVLNKRKQASLISAYALLDKSFEKYKDKVTEIYGDETDMRVREEIAKDVYVDEDIHHDPDKLLFYDDYSGRYFDATMERVIQVEYLINQRLAVSGYVCLNELYDLLNMPELDGGDEIGWSTYMLSDMYMYSWIEFHHEKVVMDDGLECYIITMPIGPEIGFEEY